MRWLTEERGATMVFIAVAGVALVGLTAFTIDAGAMYSERRQLQSGADAAVLAIAEDCATGAQPCNSSFAANTAEIYADDNAEDGTAAVQGVELDTVAKTVTATVITDDGGGGTVLAPFFAQVLGFEGSTVGATATAQWGTLGSLFSAFPLIISDCEYNGGTEVPPGGFVFHEGNSDKECGHSTSGFDDPGGFGWLDTIAGCGVAIDIPEESGRWVTTDPGASPSTGCTPSSVKKKLFLDEPCTWESAPVSCVMLPIYDDLEGTGNNIRYRAWRFEPFHVTGYHFGGGYTEYREDLTHPPCSGSQRCLAGYFLTGATTSIGGFGGTDSGVILIKLTN